MKANIYSTKSDLVEAAAEKLLQAARKSAQRQGRFSLALAGGSTPRDLYARLAQPAIAAQIPWARVHLFWGDERMVPPDHPDSNYRMVRESLLQRIAIPEENVHRMRGEVDPAGAAEQYQQELQRHFAGRPPRFDLILLGLGDDGHTASLFPGTWALDETEREVAEVFVPQFGAWRLTLTLPVLNHAREVWFLVCGAAKAGIVRRIGELKQPARNLPASLIHPKQGALLWLLDAEAAAMINATS